MNQDNFGSLLRYYRRRARDTVNGGSLSQDRLADLLSVESGIIYSRGAVSDWERGKGHIHKDARHMLVSLLRVLHETGGLQTVEEADAWLEAGNYRTLNAEEMRQVSAEWLTADTQSTGDDTLFMAPALPPHDIIGRDELLDTLKQQLFAGRNLALSAINGLPGVGKTTLAALLAHDAEVRTHFPDGVLWVGLGRDPDLFHQLGLWAQAVGVDSAELERMGAIKLRANAIHETIRQKQMLLVIDDMWDEAPVALFQLGGNACTHILTTRQPRIAAGFAGARVLKVAELSEAHAFELLRRLAPRVVAQEPDAAREIVRTTGGLPLALVLIGNHLRMQGATGQGRRIRSALTQLQSAETRFHIERTQSVLDGEAHPSLPIDAPISLTTIIGVSDEMLSTETRATLHVLALFPPKPNAFAEEAALFIADTTTEALDELSDHGLLETVGRDRYTLHQSISDYARLQQPAPTYSERFIAFYKQFVAAHASDHVALGQEMDNIAAAISIAAAVGRYDLLWELLDAVFPFLESRGQYELAQNWLTLLESADLSGAAQAKVHYYFGRIALHTNENDVAQQHWEQGLQVARTAQTHEEAVMLLSNLSILVSQNGQYDRATALLQDAIIHAQLAENRIELCRAHGNLGRFAYIRDDYVAAEKHLAEAYHLAMDNDLFSLACGVLNLRGLAAMNLGAFASARDHFEEGLRIARENRFTNRILELLVNVGQLLINTRQFSNVYAYLEEGLDLARQLGDRAKESHILKNLAVADANLGDYERAEERFIAADAVAAAIENQWLIANTAAHHGFTAANIGNLSQAETLLHKSLDLTPLIGNEKPIVALAYFGLAQVAWQNGQSDVATTYLDTSLAALTGTGHLLIDEIQAWRDERNL